MIPIPERKKILILVNLEEQFPIWGHKDTSKLCSVTHKLFPPAHNINKPHWVKGNMKQCIYFYASLSILKSLK